MKHITFDYSNAASFVAEHEFSGISSAVRTAKDTLLSKSGAGNNFLGWIDLPVN